MTNKRERVLSGAVLLIGMTAMIHGCGSESDSNATGSSGSGGASGSAASGSGASSSGAVGGASASGGASGSGGTTTGSGGSTAGAGGSSGGSGGAGATGSCAAGGAPAAATTACALTQDRIRITEVDVGGTVVSDEAEASLHPVVISALPSGGSRLAWMGDDGLLHITTLNADDQVTGTPVTLAVNDFSDLYADDAGGVVLATRDAQGSGDRHCGTLTNLCGNASNLPGQYECWDMFMVRFDCNGETWATQLTESSAGSPPYLNSPTDTQVVRFIWWYAHHGRIAFDGTNYAGYFGSAVSLSQACVDADSTLSTGVNIHQGDRMKVVGPGGELLTGHDSFDWGCSHSGYERVVWDGTAGRFVAVCKTDNQNRIALAPRYSTIRPVDLGAANLGDLVLASGGGYWLSTSDVEAAGAGNADVLLLRFGITSGAATLSDEIPVAATAGLNERAPHLAAYGTDGLLVVWETSSSANDIRRNDASRQLHAQVRNRATGAAIGAALDIPGVLGNRYHEFRSFPDGSVAFPAPGSTAQSVKILRVLPCAP